MEAGLALGLTDSDYAQTVIQFFTDYGYDLALKTPSLDGFLSSVALDKKRKGGAVRFVLQRSLGETFQQEIPEEILRQVLAAYSS